MTFREPKTWRGRVGATDLNREIRDQFFALRAALTALEAGTGGPSAGILPLGFIIGWAGSTIPTGWLVCDGQLVSKSLYPDLYDSLLTVYGADTMLTFALPNSSGRFLRGGSSPGDGTVGTRGTTGGYTSNTLTLSLGTTNVSQSPNSSTDGGGHSHTYNTQHAHNYNHSSNAYSVSQSHSHGNNDHAHGAVTGNSGGGNSGTGNLGTCGTHAHNESNSNSTTHNAANHTHTGDQGNVNVTVNTVGHSTATSSSSQGGHFHSSPHAHDIAHSHMISERRPEHDDVNWLINYQVDPGENWFILGLPTTQLGVSLIGA